MTLNIRSIQSTLVISTSSGPYKKCRDIRMSTETSTTVCWWIQGQNLGLYKYVDISWMSRYPMSR